MAPWLLPVTITLSMLSLQLLLGPALSAAREEVVHQVGGTPGWSLPSRSNVNYTQWASTQTFFVGDTLYFNYSSAYHNVLQVSATQYASCDATAPIETWADGATRIKLESAGTFYYICGVAGHCGLGQLVAVPVRAAAAPAPAAVPDLAPSPESSPAPAPATTSSSPAPAPETPSPSSSSSSSPPPSSSSSTALSGGNSTAAAKAPSPSSATSSPAAGAAALVLLLLSPVLSSLF